MNITNIFLIFAFCTITNAYSNRNHKIVKRIVGGEVTKIEDVPYMAALIKNGSIFCGAVIISRHFLLTAAHCFEISEKLVIVTGSNNANTNGEKRDIDLVFVHPSYSIATPLDFDIALIKVKNSIEFNNVQKPIKLPNLNDNIHANEFVTIPGYGSDNYNLLSDGKLRLVSLPVVDYNICKKVMDPEEKIITNEMFCAGYLETGNKDICRGDSGSPVILNNTLVGIVSWGEKYSCASPGVVSGFTKVSNSLNWIIATIKLNSKA